MIVDNIADYRRYLGLSDLLDKALACMAETDFAKFPCGRHDLFEGAYVNVFEAETKPIAPDSRWETHRDYIDIHIMLDGEECFCYRHADELQETVPYDADADATFYVSDGKGGGSAKLTVGTFALCFPEDAHLPLTTAAEPKKVKKAVMKVRV